jgi:magnesium chelatase subunit I
MKKRQITTLGELKKSGYKPNTIHEELSKNLKDRLKSGQPSF